jgi:nucleotide-binding universal stress UspA family protein
MTSTIFDITARESAEALDPQHVQVRNDSPRPRRLLAVVDGSERTNRVVDYLASIGQRGEAIEVVILNVQEKPADGRLRGYQSFKRNEIEDRLINDLGGPIVTSVSRRLEQAGIRNVGKVRIGEPVQEILGCAAEDRCDAVVVGDPRATIFQRWLVDMTGLSAGWSIAARVVLLAEVPVVVVK